MVDPNRACERWAVMAVHVVQAASIRGLCLVLDFTVIQTENRPLWTKHPWVRFRLPNPTAPLPL